MNYQTQQMIEAMTTMMMMSMGVGMVKPMVLQTSRSSIEIPFKDAPDWLKKTWLQLWPHYRPKVKVHPTKIASIGQPFDDRCVRNIVAWNGREVMSKYVPSYDSILAVGAEERKLYFGGKVKIQPSMAIAVLDACPGNLNVIDLYIHPDDRATIFEPSKYLAPPLTERQYKILATTRAYISSYRREVFRENQVTQPELDELRKMGMLNKVGAITIMGRNTVGDKKPWF